MKGGNILALQEILGHANETMTMRYAHLSRGFARKEIERLNDLTDVTGMSPDQIRPTPIITGSGFGDLSLPHNLGTDQREESDLITWGLAWDRRNGAEDVL